MYKLVLVLLCLFSFIFASFISFHFIFSACLYDPKVFDCIKTLVIGGYCVTWARWNVHNCSEIIVT